MPRETIGSITDSTRRFSSRVGNYVRFRPSYPPEVMAHLRDALGLAARHRVADIGSGTGIFTRLLLENANTVFAVEPNAEMRAAAERELALYPGFHSISGSAEATGLAPACVDFVTVAQAFHWFDIPQARAEFRRILTPGGRAILIWNTRESANSEFLGSYEALLRRFCDEYDLVKQNNVNAEKNFSTFFQNGQFGAFRCPNEQYYDFEGLVGRVESASYAPPPGHPAHAPLMKALRQLFDRHQRDGQVLFAYRTDVYYGEPSV